MPPRSTRPGRRWTRGGHRRPERFNHDEVVGGAARDEPAAAERGPRSSPSTRTNRCRGRGRDDLLSADQIAAKVNGHARGLCPARCSHLTMFVDVQGKALFYLVAAWEDDFTGHVIDYGTERTRSRRTSRSGTSSALRRSVRPRRCRGRSTRTGAAHRSDGGSRVAARRRRDGADRPLPDRRQLGIVHGCRLSVLSPEPARQRADAQPRHYVGASSLPFSDYKAQTRRAGRAELACRW